MKKTSFYVVYCVYFLDTDRKNCRLPSKTNETKLSSVHEADEAIGERERRWKRERELNNIFGCVGRRSIAGWCYLRFGIDRSGALRINFNTKFDIVWEAD